MGCSRYVKKGHPCHDTNSSQIDELQKPELESNVDNPVYGQPLCTALQIALVDLLESWDISPAAVIGHSSGEIAAA